MTSLVHITPITRRVSHLLADHLQLFECDEFRFFVVTFLSKPKSKHFSLFFCLFGVFWSGRRIFHNWIQKYSSSQLIDAQRFRSEGSYLDLSLSWELQDYLVVLMLSENYVSAVIRKPIVAFIFGKGTLSSTTVVTIYRVKKIHHNFLETLFQFRYWNLLS